MSDERVLAEARDEAIEKALLYVFQLSGKNYHKMQSALSESAFARALEQDGYVIVPKDRPLDPRCDFDCDACKACPACGGSGHRWWTVGDDSYDCDGGES